MPNKYKFVGRWTTLGLNSANLDTCLDDALQYYSEDRPYWGGGLPLLKSGIAEVTRNLQILAGDNGIHVARYKVNNDYMLVTLAINLRKHKGFEDQYSDTILICYEEMMDILEQNPEFIKYIK